jgi:tetratricopeptide (TPR) repeat protein
MRKLGAFGTSLALLANFFEQRWTEPLGVLDRHERAWVLNQAGNALRGAGRIAEALLPMQSSAQAAKTAGDFENAAIGFTTLSQLLIVAGDIQTAIRAANEAIELANRTANPCLQIIARATAADAFHQSGRLTRASELFDEAERLQAGQPGELNILYSLRGFGYCDLLVTCGRAEEAVRRAREMKDKISGYDPPLVTTAVHHLALARALPANSDEAVQNLDLGIAVLRRAGTTQHLPLGLLTRTRFHRLAGRLDAARGALERVTSLCKRSGMAIHLCDCWLELGRIHLDSGDADPARGACQNAASIIMERAYHRRDFELAELEDLLPASAGKNDG